MKFTEAEWIALSKCLDKGLELSGDAQRQWLEGLTGLDAGLKPVLAELLRRHAEDASGLPGTLPGFAPAGEAIGDLRAECPVSIGRYRIIGLVGEGGMGSVYEAEQEQPRRRVALKVVKPGLTSSEVLRRFGQESRSLARLQHPGIAQIYEAGIADTGFGPQPWFAMEFISGLSLLEFANARRLDVKQRLKILIQTCEAVHHAHLRGVIHRDLKPSNILVDQAGRPRIVDFGVALIADGEMPSARETRLGDLVGTLAYMSPEQVLADPSELDARSDVYSLGVVLYELLAGRLPFPISGRLPEAIRAIREENPVPLGTMSRAYRGDLETGDLETIVAKALAKDKTRRYDSAADLAADLGRYLTDNPILARPPSVIYQLRKLGARHKPLATAVAALFVALAGGLLATSWESVRANRERDRAEAAEHNATRDRDRALHAEKVADGERVRAQQERNRAMEEAKRAETQSATATAVNDFLRNDLLALAGPRAQINPKTMFDPDLKVRAVLDRAAARIEGKFDSQPPVEAAIRQTIGSAYADLGLFPEAAQQMTRALALRRRVLGSDHPDTLSSIDALGNLYLYTGNYGPAEALLTEALERRKRLQGARDPATLATMGGLATLAGLMQSDYARAADMLNRVLDVQRSALGEEHPDTLANMNNLASQYVNLGSYAPADALYRKVLEIKRRVMGEEHPSTLMTMNSLGVVDRYQGKYAEAEALLTRTLQARRQVLGEDHQETLASARSLALLYAAQARYAPAETLLAETLRTGRRVLGERHPETLAAMNNVAEIYLRQNRYPEAESMFREVLEMRRILLPANHSNITNVLVSLGSIKLRQRRYDEAEPLLREALDGQEQTSPDGWRRYYTESLLGSCLTGSGRYAGAEQLVLSGYKGLVARQDSVPFENRAMVNEARNLVSEFYQASGKPSPATGGRQF